MAILARAFRLGNASLDDDKHSVSGTVQPGLSSKPYSAGLGMLVIVSTMISVFSAWLLAFEFLGYHAPGHAPHPTVSILLLLLGLWGNNLVLAGTKESGNVVGEASSTSCTSGLLLQRSCSWVGC